MEEKRGQVQTENILIVGLVVAASLVLLYVMLMQVSESSKSAKVEDAVNSLVAKANEIVVLGQGSKDAVMVDLPEAVTATDVRGDRIIITISKQGELYNISKSATPVLIGTLEKIVGLQKVFLQKINDTLVLIGETPVLFSLKPSCVGGPILESETGATITVRGAGFQSNAAVLMDGIPLVGGMKKVLNGGTLTFQIRQPPTHQGSRQIAVQNPDGRTSNSLGLLVLNVFTFCGGG